VASTVNDVMTRGIVTVGVEQTIRDAAELMRAADIHVSAGVPNA
jgi:CBS domain-containing protein